MTDNERFTTFCGHLDELNGLHPDDGVASSTLIAQVWRGGEMVAECGSHEWAERVAAALNRHDATRTPSSGEGE